MSGTTATHLAAFSTSSGTAASGAFMSCCKSAPASRSRSIAAALSPVTTCPDAVVAVLLLRAHPMASASTAKAKTDIPNFIGCPLEIIETCYSDYWIHRAQLRVDSSPRSGSLKIKHSAAAAHESGQPLPSVAFSPEHVLPFAGYEKADAFLVDRLCHGSNCHRICPRPRGTICSSYAQPSRSWQGQHHHGLHRLRSSNGIRVGSGDQHWIGLCGRYRQRHPSRDLRLCDQRS